jgi:hypothetical protein
MVRAVNIPANCYSFGIDFMGGGYAYYMETSDSEEVVLSLDEEWDNRNSSHCWWWHKRSGVVILFQDEPGIDWDFIQKITSFQSNTTLQIGYRMEALNSQGFEPEPRVDKHKPTREFITLEDVRREGFITTREEGVSIIKARYFAMYPDPDRPGRSLVNAYTGRRRANFYKNREEGTQIVYVLTNPSMPGQVKIGFTKNNAEDRAKSLYTTGVSTPFQVAYEYVCVDGMGLEQQIHKVLDEFRVADSREFFYVSAGKAIDTILEVSGDKNG